jgi:ATP-binding cassette subfamily B protein
MPPHGRRPMKKEKLDTKSLKKLFIYAKRYVPALIIGIILAIGSSVTSIIGPNRIKELVNNIFDMDKFTPIAISLVIIYSLGVLLGYFQSLITNIVTQKLSKELRTDINNKLNKLPLSYFDSHARGNILSVVTNDVDTIGQSLSQSLASIFSSTVLFIGVVFMMFYTSWILALVTISASLVGIIGLFIVSMFSQRHFNRRQQMLAEMNSDIEEIYTNHQLVITYNAKNQELERFKEINTKLYNANWKSQFLGGLMMPMMNFSGNLAYSLIFIVGIAIFISKGQSDVAILGTLISFTIYARLFTQPLQSISQNITSMQQASAASRRVFEFLDEQEVSNEDNKDLLPSVINGDVSFKNVKFSYVPDKEIIHDFNASIKRGQKVAIVGPTGAGKTTIVNLLMRFYDVNSGEILIDGLNINNIKRESIRESFDMILQDTWLFDGTIKENLVFNNPNVKDEAINNAIDAVGLTHYINSLPNGLDTKISGNMSLSEGQKQQLTIARAIIKDAPMLILDEATSNVDTRTEVVIQNAMDKLTIGRTSFVIAHRLSTIKNADVILVINNGDIVEMGNHNELLKKNGFYSELYNSQFAVFD